MSQADRPAIQNPKNAKPGCSATAIWVALIGFGGFVIIGLLLMQLSPQPVSDMLTFGWSALPVVLINIVFVALFFEQMKPVKQKHRFHIVQSLVTNTSHSLI